MKQRLQSMVAAEGAAQFNAQMKLLGQSAASYLDLCDSPVKCEELLNRITVQIEELEGTFADFEDFIVQLSDKRTSIYESFEQRKVALIEQRNRKSAALLTAAERILKVIQNRLAGFKSVEEINTYMASDLMIAKVREIIEQLLGLGDSVKADDLQGRMKSAQQDAVRQLKDRQELFVGGTEVIQLGKHRFNINTQPLDLTVVNRDGVQHIHLTSTKYFEPITDEAFLATREVWDQEAISENAQVYRAEYLAYRMLQSLESGAGRTIADALALNDADRLSYVQEFMAARYQDAYTKGIHDVDGAQILHVLLSTHVALQLARYHPAARACAVVYWVRFCREETRSLWSAKLNGFSARNKLFPGDVVQRDYIGALQGLLAVFAEQTKLFPIEETAAAGEYLFYELIGGDTFVVSHEADHLSSAFRQHLVAKSSEEEYDTSTASLADHPASQLQLIRDWVRGFLLGREGMMQYLDEIAAILFCGEGLQRFVVEAGTTQTISGMRGAHSVIREGRYEFEYFGFHKKLTRFETQVLPQFEEFHRLKQQMLERERKRLRLQEFKPRVLTSFVRNQLIDRVYLPLVGDNLAKQIGAAGDQKRTDLMGLLLLISPPGYGKTTLMEYVANRLGIIFVKINGPALGHAVTSLDPEEAPNAAAREEIQKLNLALEMGDNVMLCVDDIQHCNPEFLQKFISLCDGQRRIEGVWRGQPRTYDLRGRKVVVVMAGNPYTESGQKFKIPDMLSNRADTYNLGDIIGGSAEWFKASYLENAVTSNAAVAPLANKSQKDVRSFVRIAETGERDTEGFEGSYSAQEVEEIVAVMKKLASIRDVVLKMNMEYIHSAAQADDYRTEPPFRLQGSYRNMNRLAEKVIPIMNDAEVRGLILDHYQNESQTLTTGAEANLLKFKELIDALTPEEKERWEEMKKTFRRNLVSRSGDQADPVGRLVTQLATFQGGLEAIQETLESRLSMKQEPLVLDLGPIDRGFEALRTTIEDRLPKPNDNGNSVASKIGEGLKALREDLARAIGEVHTSTVAERMTRLAREMETLYATLSTLKDVTTQQRDRLAATQELWEAQARKGTVEIELTREMLNNERAFLDHFHQVLSSTRETDGASEQPTGEQT